MFGDKKKCVECGHQLGASDKFCAECGTPQPGASTTCPNCGAEVPAAARFCTQCRHALRADTPPVVENHHWRKGPDDFAARIEVDDLPGFFRKELVVDAGTRALLLVDGRNESGEIGPGAYSIQQAGLSGFKKATAILVHNGDVELTFAMQALWTSDPIRVDIDCSLVVRIDNAPVFLANLMKGDRTYPLTRLKTYLETEVENAAALEIAQCTIRDLAVDLGIRDRLATRIEGHLDDTFSGAGLAFDRVRTVSVRAGAWTKAREIREDLYLQISEEEAKLAGRTRLDEVVNERELAEIASQEGEAARYERRIQVLDRMRRAAQTDRMNEVRSETDLETFLRGLDRETLIRDEEYAELKRRYAEEREDHDLQRRFVIRSLEMQKQLELDRQQLAGEMELLEHRLRRRRVQLEADLGDERIAAIERKKIEVEKRRAEIEIWILEEESEARKRALEREQDRLDGELGVHMLELMDQRKLKRQREEMLIEMERRERELELEIKRIRELSNASPEVLISYAGPEQAAVLGELARTRALAGWTPEQILAAAAEKRPEVIHAFEEKYRAEVAGASGTHTTEMYERILGVQQASAQQSAQAQTDAMAMLKALAEKALETQRDTAAGVAGGRQPAVVVPSGGGPSMIVSGGGERFVVCGRCRAESPVGTKFCAQCGNPFFDS